MQRDTTNVLSFSKSSFKRIILDLFADQIEVNFYTYEIYNVNESGS